MAALSWKPWLAIGLVLGQPGCSTELSPTPGAVEVTFGVRTIATDTIQHQFLDTIVVRFRGGNLPVVGEMVRLTGGRRLFDSPALRGPELDIRLVPVPILDTSFRGDVVGRTDSRGELRFTVKTGYVAGRDYLFATAPLFDVSDSIPFEVRPGGLSAIEASPTDTAVLVGATYPVTVAARDRAGNTLEITPIVTSDSSTVARGSGASVTGLAIGRATLRVQAASATLTMAVSVVPAGIIAGTFGDRIVVGRTDGRSVGWTPSLVPLEAAGLDWQPGGDILAFHMGGAIHLADSTGHFSRLFERQQPFADGEAWMRYLPDGRTVLLNANAKIWRIVLATGAADQIPSPASAVDLRASPSPDGLRAVFSRNGFLSIIELRSKAITPVGVLGYGARWSPDGAWIAYGDVDSGLWIIRPNGTGARRLNVAGIGYAPEIDWSPDGKWLVATTGLGLTLVDPVSLVTLPLGQTKGQRYPAWRPDR